MTTNETKQKGKSALWLCTVIGALVGACLMVAGCGETTAKGTDSAVQREALNIARKDIRQIYITKMGYGRTSYEALKKEAANNPTYADGLKAIDKVMEILKVSLENVKVTAYDKNAHKSSNTADLVITIDGKSFKMPFKYKAQLDKNGKLLVETDVIRF